MELPQPAVARDGVTHSDVAARPCRSTSPGRAHALRPRGDPGDVVLAQLLLSAPAAETETAEQQDDEDDDDDGRRGHTSPFERAPVSREVRPTNSRFNEINACGHAALPSAADRGCAARVAGTFRGVLPAPEAGNARNCASGGKWPGTPRFRDTRSRMCGIVGVIGRNGAERSRHAARRVAPRPDDEGTFVAGNVALGHRRLAILDLSPAGHQPMVTPDGRYALVMNGESTTTFRCAKRGWRQCSVPRSLRRGDGAASPRAAGGGGAFGSERHVRPRVRRSRHRRRSPRPDRLGIKTLYCADTPRGFGFASEAKALLAPISRSRGWISRQRASSSRTTSFPAPYCAFVGAGAASGEIGAASRRRDGREFDLHRAEVRRAPVEERDATRACAPQSKTPSARTSCPTCRSACSSRAAWIPAPSRCSPRARRPRPSTRSRWRTAPRARSSTRRTARGDRASRRAGPPRARISGDDVYAALAGIVYAMDEPSASAIPNWFVAEARSARA